jgi:sec-independent protein translocase protein TatA
MPVPGPLELIIVLVIALVILGPGKLPDVGAALGKGLREFRRASSDLQEAARVDATPASAPASTPPAPAAPATPAAVAPPAAPAAPPQGDATTQPKA